MATLVQGTVKFPAKVFETKYGPRAQMVVRLQDGQEVKLWGSPDGPLMHYEKGAAVALVEKNGKYEPLMTGLDGVVEDNHKENGLEIPTPVDDRVAQECELMAICFHKMSELLPDVDTALVQAMATSVYIQLHR
ncbi:MAG: hypothetical protein NZ821_06680 [Gloeomargarita sp. SKYB31]|nr:hypothetical protein [Gloeomargarita sp. SKYB31]